MLTGLDVLVKSRFSKLKGKKLGVLCHQSSIASDFRHVVDHLLAADCDVRKVFGPQHGPAGHTQDNMVEWDGYTDPRTGLSTFSLYGDVREPTAEMLKGIDILVIDLQDVGCRVYTLIWTMSLCLRACERGGVSVTILDRPNPIGTVQEGPVLEKGFESFVGLSPLPMRHGMTMGEIARHLQDRDYPNLSLDVIECEGLDRSCYGDQTGMPWIPPSPNMPTVDTAVVYPGMVLLEGTNISEGRGTTRPFETFGAPWLGGHELCESLNRVGLKGVHFRPVTFQPTFQKYQGELCHGAFLHVIDRQTFRPVLAGIAVLIHCYAQRPESFSWRRPPYEYEETLLPIDILAGNSWVRQSVEDRETIGDVKQKLDATLSSFEACQVSV